MRGPRPRLGRLVGAARGGWGGACGIVGGGGAPMREGAGEGGCLCALRSRSRLRMLVVRGL